MKGLLLPFRPHCCPPGLPHTGGIHLPYHVVAPGEMLTCRLVARQLPSLQFCETVHPLNVCVRRMADGAYQPLELGEVS